MAEIPRGSVWKHSRMNAWVVDYRDAMRKRHVIKAGKSKSVAEALLNSKLKQIALEGLSGLEHIESKTLGEVAQEYLKHARVNKRSWSRDEGSLENLKVHFTGARKLSTITERDIEEYKATRRQVRSPATVNRELACLKHLFNLAIRWGYARENPVKKVRLFKESNQRIRFLEPHERERLLAFCSEQVRPVVLVALNTGLRLGELLGLTWADVDLQRRLICVRDSKTGEGRYIPMNDEAMMALARLPRNLNIPNVFFNRDGQPYRSVRTAFETACRKAGIKDFRFHDLRHTFASYLVMGGVDLNTVRELMGHKTLAMTMRYAHLAPQHKQAAVDRLAALWDRQRCPDAEKAVNI